MNRDYEMCAMLIETELRGRTFNKAEDVLKAAFKVARNHWMYTDPETQFKGGIGAALMTLKSGPEFERIKGSVESLRRVSAFLSAAQAGLPMSAESLVAAAGNIDDLIPLRKMWEVAQGPEFAEHAP